MKKVDVREKLIELLETATFGVNKQTIPSYLIPSAIAEVADHLIANGVTLNVRDCHWATECAYKNGYKKGYEDGLRDRKRKEETTSSGISQRTVQALERMGQKVHGGEDG